jgi:hypothetical protein
LRSPGGVFLDFIGHHFLQTFESLAKREEKQTFLSLVVTHFSPETKSLLKGEMLNAKAALLQSQNNTSQLLNFTQCIDLFKSGDLNKTQLEEKLCLLMGHKLQSQKRLLLIEVI